MALTVLSSTVNAGDLHVGVAQADIFHKSTQAVNIGYGGHTISDNGVYFGISIDFQGGTLPASSEANTTTETTYLGMSGDLQLGYAPTQNLRIYALGTALTQAINSISGAGFGYGGGVEYQVSKSFATAVEYKKYNMSLNGLQNYDYSTVGLNLKYTW